MVFFQEGVNVFGFFSMLLQNYSEKAWKKVWVVTMTS